MYIIIIMMQWCIWGACLQVNKHVLEETTTSLLSTKMKPSPANDDWWYYTTLFLKMYVDWHVMCSTTQTTHEAYKEKDPPVLHVFLSDTTVFFHSENWLAVTPFFKKDSHIVLSREKFWCASVDVSCAALDYEELGYCAIIYRSSVLEYLIGSKKLRSWCYFHLFLHPLGKEWRT